MTYLLVKPFALYYIVLFVVLFVLFVVLPVLFVVLPVLFVVLPAEIFFQLFCCAVPAWSLCPPTPFHPNNW